MKFSLVRRSLGVLAAVAGAIALTVIGAGAASAGTPHAKARVAAAHTVKKASKKVSIEVWDVQYFPKQSGSAGAFGKAEVKIDQAFEKKYPNIAVKHVGVPGSDFITDMREFVASKSGPDVVTNGGQTFPVTSGFAKAMRPMYDLITPTLKKQLGGYLVEESQGDPAHYAIPNEGNVHAVYYNKGYFHQAGIKTLPTTFTQLLSDCTALKSIGVTPIANGWSGPAGTILWNYGIMSQLFTQPQLTAWANLKLGWTASPFSQGLSDLQQMVSAGCFGDPATAATETDTDGLTAFQGGRGGMLFWNAIAPSTFTSPANIGVFALPKLPQSAYPAGTPDGGYNANWSLMSYSKHCLAAWDYISFNVGPQAQQIMWDVSKTLPVNNAVKLSGGNGIETELLKLATNKYLHTGIGGTMSAAEATLQQQLMPEVISGQLSASQFISQMSTERSTVTLPPGTTTLPKTAACTMNS